MTSYRNHQHCKTGRSVQLHCNSTHHLRVITRLCFANSMQTYIQYHWWVRSIRMRHSWIYSLMQRLPMCTSHGTASISGHGLWLSVWNKSKLTINSLTALALDQWAMPSGSVSNWAHDIVYTALLQDLQGDSNVGTLACGWSQLPSLQGTRQPDSWLSLVYNI